MPILEILRTAKFKLAAISAGGFALCVLLLFGFIYWQADIYETGQIDGFLERRVAMIARGNVDETLRALIEFESRRKTHEAQIGLFTTDGASIAGELKRVPSGLRLDGKAHAIDVPASDFPEGLARAAAVRLPDGRVLVIVRDVRQIEELQATVLRALEIGLAPALALSLLLGALLGSRALKRVRSAHRLIERIMQGNLRERLPTGPNQDDFDRLAGSVNGMLDEIGRLLEEMKGVGDDIAHDLRTPLTRVRTRLERGRQRAGSKAELEETIEAAIKGLDQALAITTALLRITEIEDGRRRAAFTDFDLASVAHDLVELYEPIAEMKDVTLAFDIRAAVALRGDPDLMMEAMANIVDNAVKFTPPGGIVQIDIARTADGPLVRISDTGPGIAIEERGAVLRRFYRSDKSRHLPGSGLGLGLVSAIAKLHGFRIVIDDNDPGCVFEIHCGDKQPPADFVDFANRVTEAPAPVS